MSHIYQLNKLSFYYAKKKALSLESLNIQAGITTALIGANGSGKSTLLNLLAFLVCPQAGEILFCGQRVKSKDLLQYRRQVGLLPQKPFMLRGSVYDNMKLALKIRGIKSSSENIHRVLKQLEINHCAEQPAGQLSGGELQKAALARILIVQPKVLLLDEPFSYLDQCSAQALEVFLREYVQATGHTLIFSTHDRLLGFAMANEVVALADGEQVMTPLINLFHGQVIDHVFYSGAMQIVLTETVITARHASINPQDIVLSTEAFVSSMRNHFQGRVVLISDEMGSARVNVDTGVVFQALITYQALKELNIKLGDKLWVNFKSNAVVVF